MLSKANRLKRRKDLERVFKTGRTFKEGFLVMKVAENGLPLSRFGFVVGKKFSPKANIRNKIRRKLREAVRARLSELKKGADVVFIVHSPLMERDRFKKDEQEELGSLIDGLLRKANFLK